MRVVIVVPSLVVGGAENMVAQLVSNINKEDFNVRLIVMSDNIGTNIDLIVKKAGVDVVYLGKKLGFSLKALQDISKKLTDFQPDIIHTHLSSWVYVFFWSLIHHIKIVHTIHSMPIRECTGIARKLIRALYKRRRIVPVAISEIIMEQTAVQYNLPVYYIETIYNPVNVGKFSIASRRKVRDGITFVNVARFSELKNQSFLVEAFSRVLKELPTAHLVLVGDGELRAQVETKVMELHLEEFISFTGLIPNVVDILMQSDIFVLPSRFEGLPLSILEAMAAGLPVIATSVGGVPDIVKGNGILIDEGDIKGLTKAMLKLAEDERLRRAMSKVAINEVKKYDISEVTLQYERLYAKYGKL